MGKSDDEDTISVLNKRWAQKYILDPLTCPEPSQECGPGSTFRTGSPQRKISVKPKVPPPARSETSQPSQLPVRKKSFLRVPDRYSRPKRDKHSTKGYTLIDSPPPKSASLYPPSESPGPSNAPAVSNWSQGTILARADSVTLARSPMVAAMSQPRKEPDVPRETFSGLHRAGSLSARFPGDMSHRPLEVIKKEHRQADRLPQPHSSRRHHRAPKQPSDTIDSLDVSGPVGGIYHHDGPYDATMAARNTNKHYSPLSALQDSNMEALKATPREYIQDSLQKHVPLQGTAAIPPGMRDMSGRTMAYEEGADLMREPDAPGGAYKRYDFIPYHEDDLKGKGEPSFTAERDHKEQDARLQKHSRRRGTTGTDYEMLPGTNAGQKTTGTRVRQRSVSNDMPGPSRKAPPMAPNTSTSNDVHRREPTSKRITEGFRRRFGSLRRKKSDGAE